MSPREMGPRDPMREVMAALLAQPRFEIMPLRGGLQQAAELPAGATVTVTASPSRGTAATIELAEKLAAQGFGVVPHLAARQVRDNAELSEVLGRLDRAGIRDLFVVGGDAGEPAGKFADGLSLLRVMAEIGHRLTRIGVPSYPEGHHAIDDNTLWSALRAKQRYAGYTVTQLCFDADVVCSFAAAARHHGITLPIVAGVPGVVDAGTLLRVSVRIGIGDSVRFVRGHRFPAVRSAGNLLRPGGYRPGALVRKLGMHVRDGRCDLAGLHIYTFNQVGPTVRWLHNAHRRAAA